MGGFTTTRVSNASANQNGDESDDESAYPSTAENLYARLCETQEVQLRRTKAENHALQKQMQELEQMTKEVIEAMEDTMKGKDEVQGAFEALKHEADEGKDALVQALKEAEEAQGKIVELEGQVDAIRGEKESLSAELLIKKEEIERLNRWNRQEVNERCEAEKQIQEMRRQIDKLLRRVQAKENQDASARSAEEEEREATLASLQDELRRVRSARENAESMAVETQAQLEKCQTELSRSRGRVTLCEKALAEAREETHAVWVQTGQAMEEMRKTELNEKEGEIDRLSIALKEKSVDYDNTRAALLQAKEEIERLEKMNHGQGRRIIELDALYGDAIATMELEKGKVRDLNGQVLELQAAVGEAQDKAHQEGEQVVQLKLREEELLNEVRGLEALHTENEVRLAVLREEVNKWREQAEDNVAEWVGITTTAATEPDNADDIPSSPAPSISPPNEEDLDGLDPVQALMDENLALRTELGRLRAVTENL